MELVYQHSLMDASNQCLWLFNTSFKYAQVYLLKKHQNQQKGFYSYLQRLHWHQTFWLTLYTVQAYIKISKNSAQYEKKTGKK